MTGDVQGFMKGLSMPIMDERQYELCRGSNQRRPSTTSVRRSTLMKTVRSAASGHIPHKRSGRDVAKINWALYEHRSDQYDDRSTAEGSRKTQVHTGSWEGSDGAPCSFVNPITTKLI